MTRNNLLPSETVEGVSTPLESPHHLLLVGPGRARLQGIGWAVWQRSDVAEAVGVMQIPIQRAPETLKSQVVDVFFSFFFCFSQVVS